MDNATLLKIAGILVSSAFAYWRIRTSKKLKDKTELSLLTQAVYPLFTTFKERFELIKVQFNWPVNTNVFYYRGSLFNSGTLDIDKKKFYKPFTLEFPKGCKILECNIIDASLGLVEIYKEFEENKLILSWDLLKPNENFTFELIVESALINEVEKFEKEISTSHRISDLGNIPVINVSGASKITFPRALRLYAFEFIMAIIVAVILIGSVTVGLKLNAKPFVDVCNNEFIHTSSQKKVGVEYLNDSTLLLTNSDTLIEKVSMAEFKNHVTVEPLVSVEDGYALIITPILIFAGLFLGVIRPFYKTITDEIRKGKIVQHLKSKTV